MKISGEALMENSLVSVIIPCRNEEKYISICLDSVVNSQYPQDKMEIFVVDGNSNDQTKNIISGYCDKYQNIRLLNNPGKTAPRALNIGIEKAEGDYIIRLDAHSKYPPDYFSRLIFWAKKLNADNVGAIWITDVLNKTKKSLSIKKILSHPIGVGNSYFRIGTIDVIEADTVPFGCYKREVFSKIGLYNENLTRNQDIEFNKRLKANGGKIYLVPDITCTYYARETFSHIARNNYRNGYWNILTVYITKLFSSLSLRHFIPLIFILSLLTPIIASIVFHPIFLLVAIFSLFAYLLLITISSIKINDKNTSFKYLWYGFVVLHFSYGVGSLLGLLRIDKLFLHSNGKKL